MSVLIATNPYIHVALSKARGALAVMKAPDVDGQRYGEASDEYNRTVDRIAASLNCSRTEAVRLVRADRTVS